VKKQPEELTLLGFVGWIVALLLVILFVAVVLSLG